MLRFSIGACRHSVEAMQSIWVSYTNSPGVAAHAAGVGYFRSDTAGRYSPRHSCTASTRASDRATAGRQEASALPETCVRSKLLRPGLQHLGAAFDFTISAIAAAYRLSRCRANEPIHHSSFSLAITEDVQLRPDWKAHARQLQHQDARIVAGHAWGFGTTRPGAGVDTSRCSFSARL